MSDTIDPHSPANEESLLGAILINPETLQGIDLEPDEFYIERNRWAWQAIRDLRSTGQDVDVVTVCSQLDKSGKLKESGGYARIAGIMADCPSSMHAASYAHAIRDHALRRKTIRIASEIVAGALDKNSRLTDFIPAGIDNLARMAMVEDGAAHWGRFLDDLHEDTLRAYNDPRDTYGIPTGILDFDKITGGLVRGSEMKLSGEPGVGKSLLSMQMVCHAAAEGHPGVCYHLEMTGRSIARRVISGMSGVHSRAMKTGRMTEGEWPKFTDALNTAGGMPIYMSDSSTWTTAAMRVDLARLIGLYKIEWVLVDYEALLCDDPERDTNARSMVISSRLHGIIKDFNLAGLVIDDMNKVGISTGGNGQASLAGSARKLYDADSIWILKRKKDSDNVVLLVSEKQREGEGDGSRIVELQRVPGLPVFQNVARPSERDKTYSWQNQNNGG